MTLTQQNRSRLTGIICEYRDKWNAAGVEAAIKATDLQHPNDPLLVVALAVAAARDPRALTPAAMHTRTVDGPVEPAVTPRPTPSVTDPECEFHGSNIVNNAGKFICCAQIAARPAIDRPASKPYRTTVPPPPDFREQVRAAVEADRLASLLATTEAQK